MKADCLLELDVGVGSDHILELLSHLSSHFKDGLWGVSQETYMDVLDTFITSLAERRRDLQSRVAALSTAVKINIGVFGDDRFLDEYTEHAECAEKDALREYDPMLLRASTLFGNCQTLYHIENLTLEIAKKLWQNGFHDIDVHGEDGRTPLMLNRSPRESGIDGIGIESMGPEIELCSWLIRKGAKLHRPQHRSLDYNPIRTLNPIALPPKPSALHSVAASFGRGATYLAEQGVALRAQRSLQNLHSQRSKHARLLPTTVFSDTSYDDCVCACSSQGCLVSTMTLKSWEDVNACDKAPREWSGLATKHLLDLVRPHHSCLDWLDKDIIRFRTFHELELRHTCCRWDFIGGRMKLESEEIVEIREADHEKMELLESLLQEFEEKRGTQDLLAFLEGYWATRMDQVLQEQGADNEEELREIGVVLHRDGKEGSCSGD